MVWVAQNVSNILFLFSAMASVVFAVTSSDKHVIEARVFVDRLANKKYQRVTRQYSSNVMRSDMNSFFASVSDLLRSLKEYDINIDIQVKELVMLNSDFLPADLWNNKIKTSKALKSFYNWIQSKANKKYQDYDIALLYTGYRFYTAEGYAAVGSICHPQAVGVIPISGSYADVIVTAHEIGHIIGGHHDGGRKAPKCQKSSGYIMNAPYNLLSINHFHYSNCSAKSINATLDKLYKTGKYCLGNGIGIGESAHRAPRLGALMTPAQACDRNFPAQRGYVNKAAFAALGENICVKMPCALRPVANMRTALYCPTPQGLACAKGKECVQGKCVPKQTGH